MADNLGNVVDMRLECDVGARLAGDAPVMRAVVRIRNLVVGDDPGAEADRTCRSRQNENTPLRQSHDAGCSARLLSFEET